ncbi:MAG: KpsF/GutQ family sugar-phosphate isomerase [Woeseiaceae bacterium]|nr:KpsF/GutQ family sugar-phosphate isomerase [Woeseiaceae bacterium]
MKETSRNALLALAAEVLEIESNAVARLKSRLDDSFATACRICLDTEGRVVVTGMGKSGHVARKIAATLASTGTPAFFMHPAEASHGDLGMITDKDVMLAVSYSGETQEVVTILPLVKRMGARLISMTGNAQSTLAREADAHLDVSVDKEACRLNLAPTASTTATLAMGDALAVALLETRGFTEEDFAASHPSGSLGKHLDHLRRVEDVMRNGDKIPAVAADTSIRDSLVEMSGKALGMTAIVDDQHCILGIFTDGDLRRALDAGVNVHETSIGQVMHRDCITVKPDTLAAEAVHILEENKITALLVADDDRRLVGALNIHDLFRTGVM